MYRYKSYKITRKEISDRSGEIMMMVRPSMLKDLKLIENIEGATFIYSLWEGYLEDDALQKMMRFIKKKNMNFYQVHTSGHAEIDTLKKVVKKLKPGKIIPITNEISKYIGVHYIAVSRGIKRIEGEDEI